MRIYRPQTLVRNMVAEYQQGNLKSVIRIIRILCNFHPSIQNASKIIIQMGRLELFVVKKSSKNKRFTFHKLTFQKKIIDFSGIIFIFFNYRFFVNLSAVYRNIIKDIFLEMFFCIFIGKIYISGKYILYFSCDTV